MLPEGPWSQLVTGLARDSHAPRLRRMLELAVAASSRYQHAAVVGEQPENFANLHATNYALANRTDSNRGRYIC